MREGGSEGVGREGDRKREKGKEGNTEERRYIGRERKGRREVGKRGGKEGGGMRGKGRNEGKM